MTKTKELTRLGGPGFNRLCEHPQPHFRASRQREFIQGVRLQAFDGVRPGWVEGDVDLKRKHTFNLSFPFRRACISTQP